MSFLKKSDKEASSIWDWVFLSALVIGGVFLWWHLTSEKKCAIAGFTEADSLFQAGDFINAKKVYDELSNSDWMDSAQNAILYERLDTLEMILEETP